MITLNEYLKNNLPSQKVRANSIILLSKVNPLIEQYQLINPKFIVKVNSGLRSIAHNKIVGGADKSCHLTGEAIDISDPDKLLYKWLLTQPISKMGIYIEHIIDSPTWTHLQTRKTNTNPFRK